jgi:hypothetical protein
MFGKSIGMVVTWGIGLCIGLVLAFFGLKKAMPSIKKFGKDVKTEADRIKSEKYQPSTAPNVAEEAF